jgi:hypothetical protein
MFTVVALLTGRRALLFLDYFGFYARASISWQPLFFFCLRRTALLSNLFGLQSFQDGVRER